jgi:lysophospholipid acyltransferase (LPLAT)-like uncharacterized protein
MGSMNSIRRRLLGWLAANLGPLVIKAIGVTWRTRQIGLDNIDKARKVAGNVLFVFWHGRLLALTYLHRNEQINVLVSTHQDGEYIAQVIHGLGFTTSRGSSTRGGVRAILGLMGAGSKKQDLGITPDGPRGPRARCQPGAIYLAKRSGLPVVPIGVSYKPGVWMKSWDRFLVPLPFSRGVVIYGEPVVYDPSLSEEAIERARADLEERLRTVTREADHGSGQRPD